MADDLVRELQRLQRFAARLHDVIAVAGAASPPQAAATDRSGAVRVTLGPDGLPDSVRLTADWARRIPADALGGAVMAACGAAARERMAAWAANLADAGWHETVTGLRRELDEQPPAAPAATKPAATKPAATAPRAGPAAASGDGDVRPRSADVLAEDVIKALDGAAELAAPHAPAGTGRAAAGQVVVVLSGAGIVSCAVDPRWARGQSAARLAAALGDALAGARAQLAEATRSAQAAAARRAGRSSRLFGEALALLNDPKRLTQSG